MEIRHETIQVSARIHSRLNFLAGRQTASIDFVIHQWLASGHLVNSARSMKLTLYAEDILLEFPEPAFRTLRTAHTLDIQFHPDAFAAMTDLQDKFHLDTHSVLSWCLLCYEIIDDAQVLNALFSRGLGLNIGHRPLWY